MYKNGDKVLIKATVEKVTDDYVRIYAEGYGERSFSLANAPVEHKTYEQGIADAWELAKKIQKMPPKDFRSIFGDIGNTEMMLSHSYAEALAKSEAYEKKIKVGDEVYGDDEPDLFGVVTLKDTFGTYVMWKDGSSGRDTKPESLHKTGKHIDIESLLRQIGE